MMTAGGGIRGSLARWALAGATAAMASACFLGVEPDPRPTSARVRAEGTSPAPLALVVSTDFVEEYDPISGGVRAGLLLADTTYVTLPWDQTLDLRSGGRVYVELRNDLDSEVTVRLRVELDNGKGYDRSAALPVGEALAYWYVFARNSW